jgi:hypothetical protein
MLSLRYKTTLAVASICELGASVKNDRAKINGTAKMTEQQECFLFLSRHIFKTNFSQPHN